MSKFVNILGSKNYVGSGCNKIEIVTSDNCTVQPYASSIAFTNCSGCTSQVGSSGIVMINSSGCVSHANSRNITLINCSGVTTTEHDNHQVIIKNVRYYQTLSITHSSSSLLVGSGYSMYYIDATSGNITVQLPDPSKLADHPGITFKRIDSSGNTVTFNAYGSENFEFATLPQSPISTQGDSITIRTNGTDWFII